MSDFLEKIEASRLDSSTVFNIRLIIWAAVLGLILAFCLSYYRRRVIGSFVRAIRMAGATDPESAKTLAEIGQENNISAISTLKRSSSLRRLISFYQPESGESNEKQSLIIDENTRFYIKEEAETRARIQYGDENDRLWPLILGSLGVILLGILSFFFIK